MFAHIQASLFLKEKMKFIKTEFGTYINADHILYFKVSEYDRYGNRRISVVCAESYETDDEIIKMGFKNREEAQNYLDLLMENI